MQQPETFERTLRSAGRRLTPLRRELFRVLASAGRPLPAMRLLELLARRGRPVNKTTVYRELELLGSLGIIQSIDLGGRERSYELAAGQEHHHHLVCVACDRVEDVKLDEASLRHQAAQAARRRQFTITRHMLEFFGLCSRCHA